MSMLTPPGMGGEYRITGDKYPRMRRNRRRRRVVLALVASVAALGVAGWGTLQLIDVFSGDDDQGRTVAADKPDCGPTATADATAAVAPKALPKPDQITVNVLNATPRGGLAKETADELAKRGFAIGKVDNAPAKYDKKVKGTGLLLGAESAKDSALPVLGTQLAGAEQRTDGRKSKDVDLLIGSGFKKLATKKDAATALVTLTKPTPPPSQKPSC
ncbi:LytR C-terminal domain-containing protein [Streptomyces apocyni]|uniref:LytR C-terminal domain-containing protein n=1 Tax=Streptomyces apocyni TaxID=2654677 RepID=UPI0012EA5D1B|nr:LytR C-terminal domain-containing protein [Streptomyces apocyni]